MGYFTDEIVTEAGVHMLAAAAAGQTEVRFTRIEVGDGTYSISEIASLRQAASLKNVKASFAVTGINAGEEHIRIRAVVTNEGVTVGYHVREIGVYAVCDDGGTEQLFAISICGNEEQATYIPKDMGKPVEIPFTNYIQYSGDGNFTIQYRSDAYVSLQEFNEWKEKIGTLGQTVLSGTLAAGATSITFENEAVTDESRIDPYTDVYGVNPKNMAAEPGRVTLTFKPQEKDIQVKVVISNGIL